MVASYCPDSSEQASHKNHELEWQQRVVSSYSPTTGSINLPNGHSVKISKLQPAFHMIGLTFLNGCVGAGWRTANRESAGIVLPFSAIGSGYVNTGSSALS